MLKYLSIIKNSVVMLVLSIYGYINFAFFALSVCNIKLPNYLYCCIQFWTEFQTLQSYKQNLFVISSVFLFSVVLLLIFLGLFVYECKKYNLYDICHGTVQSKHQLLKEFLLYFGLFLYLLYLVYLCKLGIHCIG